VTFRKAFVLPGFDPLPPGDYLVETDEELLEGLSFSAYRRIATVMEVPAVPGHPGRAQMLVLDPEELDAALERDRASG
jgi:hypothetical protein